jgi:Domain of unknown function (DUF4389)
VTDIPAGPPVFPPPLPPAPPLPPRPYQGPGGAAPIEVGFAGPAAQRRLTVLVRGILAIPHIVVLYVLTIAAEFVLLIGWFGALFTGTLPQFAADFLSGVLRWQARVVAYLLLLTDQYPPFSLADADYTARVAVRPGPLNRLAVLFRIILIIPAAIVVGVVTCGLETITLFVVWLIVLITGRMPSALHDAISAVLRYTLRYTGYFLMLTSEYPRGLFGDQPGAGGLPGAEPYPAQGYPAEGYPADPGFSSAAGSAPAPAPPAQPPAGGGQQVGSADGYQQVSGTGPAPASGPPAPSWGQTAPSGSTPPYGTPAAAGYGTPPTAGYEALPAAGYGTQAAPAYGAPAYGAPAYGATVSTAGWSVPGGPPWPLVLSQGAKRLVGLFIVLGVILVAAYIAFFAIVIGNAKTANRAAALSQSTAAFSRLSTSMSTFGTQTTACKASHTPLPCVTAADRQASSAFATYASTQGGIGMPTSSSLAASTLIVADASRAQQVFQQLAASKSVAQYEKTVNASNLQQVLNQLELTYRQLQAKLAKG